VTPVSRLALVAGKITGESLVALCQGGCIVVFALAFGVHLGAAQVARLLPPSLACCLLGGAFGLATLAAVPNQRAAMQVFQFLIIPQYVLGGVLVPVHALPLYLDVLARAMPMRYCVELTRAAFYAGSAGYHQVVTSGVLLDVVVIVVLFAALMVVGTALFSYRERTR
jgi:ABC-2 type transport system permease protein